MTASLRTWAAFVSIAAALCAQQPNTPTATMQVNGQGGPPFPITGVQIPRGMSQSVMIQGVPNAPFIVFGSGQMLASGFPALGGLLDVNLNNGYAVLMDGLANPAFVTDGTGMFLSSVPLAANATLNSSAAFQCLVADPTNAPHNARLTAATQVVVAVGATVVNLTVNQSVSANLNLSTYGLNFPFYAQTYNNFWVNEDGNVSFNSQNTDFTPTPQELHSQQPRICPQWTDLAVDYGGSVKAIINQAATLPQPFIRIEWNNMAAWQNTGGRHDFALHLYPLSGDIEMISGPFNNPMIYDQLTGIAPGGNIFVQGAATYSAQKNLSAMPALPVIGAARESFWEWFGIVGMTYYTPTFSNPYDLTGMTLWFYAVSAGASDAYYIGA